MNKMIKNLKIATKMAKRSPMKTIKLNKLTNLLASILKVNCITVLHSVPIETSSWTSQVETSVPSHRTAVDRHTIQSIMTSSSLEYPRSPVFLLRMQQRQQTIKSLARRGLVEWAVVLTINITTSTVACLHSSSKCLRLHNQSAKLRTMWPNSPI